MGGVAINQEVFAACEALRDYVERIGAAPDLALRHGGVYRPAVQDDVHSTRVGPWEIGYQVLEVAPGFYTRKAFIRLHGDRWEDVPDAEKDPVVNAAMEAFLEENQAAPTLEFVEQTQSLILAQLFMPLVLTNRQPGLLVPGGTGRA